jgi:cytochrome c oxidase assembly factor CtaG
MVNLLIGVPLESFLAIALLSSHQTIAPMYTLSSTHTGAGVLWVLTELLTVVAIIPIYFQWMASEDRMTAREDARLDAEAARVRAAQPDGATDPQAGWTDFRPSAS